MRSSLTSIGVFLVVAGAGCGDQAKKYVPAQPDRPTSRSVALPLTVDQVRAVISQQMGISIETVSSETSLNELGADELDMVELIMELEDVFNISIPDNKLEELAGGDLRNGMNSITVYKLAALVDELVAHTQSCPVQFELQRQRNKQQIIRSKSWKPIYN